MLGRILYQQLQVQVSHALQLNLWKGWSDAEACRQTNELWLVLDGGAYLRVDGQEYRLKAGDVCLLPDILPKENGCDTASHFNVLVTHFDAKLFSNSIFRYFRCTDWVIHPAPQVFERLYTLLSACHKEYRFFQPMTLQQTVQSRLAVYAALDVFFTHTQVKELTANDWMGDTLQYITAHCHEKLSIERLAARTAMHPKHFARCFREKMGMPPGQYIARVRLERAIVMLGEGVALADISERIGFQSVQQFFRFFKKQTGYSPREYQKKQIKGEVQK